MTYSILDDLKYLKSAEKSPANKMQRRFICPVCGGGNLAIQLRGARAGVYSCYSNECGGNKIRAAIDRLAGREWKQAQKQLKPVLREVILPGLTELIDRLLLYQSMSDSEEWLERQVLIESSRTGAAPETIFNLMFTFNNQS